MNTLRIQGYERLFGNEELLLTKKGQNILEQARGHGLSLDCLCQGEKSPLPLHVRRVKSEDGFYYTIVRNKNTMEKHHMECKNYSTAEHKKIYESSSSVSEPVESHIDKKMYGLCENLLYSGWVRFLEKNRDIPNIEKLFKTIYESEFIVEQKNGKIKVNEIIFKPFGSLRYENIDRTVRKAFYRLIKEDKKMYVLGKIESIKAHEDNTKSIIKVLEVQKKNYFHLVIEDRQLREAQKNLPLANMRLISATLKETGEKYLTVDRFSIVPSTKEGIVVESTKEEEFINHLVKTKVLFKKPPRSINRYKETLSLNPQFILYDRDQLQEATIAEIFGYTKNLAEDKEFVKRYWATANERIDHFKANKRYNFFYWLWHKNELPIIYEPKLVEQEG